MSKINRTGEENINTFGSKMVIIEYKTRDDTNVYFPEYNWIAKHKRYQNFKSGKIKCPYEPRVYGIGYLGEGEYKAYDRNGKSTKCYETWKGMLKRCYDIKYHKKESTYKNCKVCEEWYNYQNFAKWYYNNYYEIEGERMCLDKDILNKGNKIYSPNTCIFVPNNINLLFVKNDKSRGNYPLGVCYDKKSKKFKAHCSIYDFKENKKKTINLDFYNTPEKAFEAYRQFKEKHIKKVADYYKNQIPEKLYDAMYKYEVCIDD